MTVTWLDLQRLNQSPLFFFEGDQEILETPVSR